jgi:acetate kinase
MKKHGIQKLGFHGLSHLSMRKSSKKRSIITVHLGSGSSVTGWLGMRTVFHSMGFSPNEGMVMMTRTGSIDPGIITYLMRKGHDADSIDRILNYESGMKAICSMNDFKTIISRKKKGNDYEKAYNAFVNSAAENVLKATIYAGNPQAIIFAGAIGENSKRTVSDIMKKTRLEAHYIQHKTNEEEIMLKEAMNLIG